MFKYSLPVYLKKRKEGSMDLDQFDRSLLNEIQNSKTALPRVSSLARKLGKPITTVHQRLKKLERLGIIKGYSAKIDFSRLGRHLNVWMLARVKADSPIEEMGEKLSALPGIVEVHYISGSWDFLIKLKLNHPDEYYHFSSKPLREILNYEAAEGFIATRTFKENNFVWV